MLRILAGLIAAPVAVSSVGALAADTWTVDPDSAALTWAVPFSGNALPGQFDDFTTDIAFSPDDLEGSTVTVTVQIVSVAMENEEQAAELPKPEWFDAETWPTATFTADSFEHLDGDDYQAEGTLTIRDATNPVTLPFTFAIDGDTAHITGGLTINRIDYGVGQGDWAIDDVVGFPVDIAFDLTATRN